MKILFLVVLVFFIAAYITEGSFDRVTGVFAVILIVLEYLTGAIAFLVQLIILFFGLIMSLPVVSSFYAALLAVIAKIHYFIFGHALKRVAKGTTWYKKKHR